MVTRSSKKAPVGFTTETFAKHITDAVAAGSSLTDLAETIVLQWQLSTFPLPKDEVKLIRDYIIEYAPRDICSKMNTVVQAI